MTSAPTEMVITVSYWMKQTAFEGFLSVDTGINRGALLSLPRLSPKFHRSDYLFFSPSVTEDSQSWAKPVVGVWLFSD